MKLTKEEWSSFVPTKTIIVELSESKYLIDTPEGKKELFLINAWDNYVELNNRTCKVLKVPKSLSSVSTWGDIGNFIEVGDIIIPEHYAIVQALDLMNDTINGNFIQIDGIKYPSIYLSEISAIIKNGIVYGMPHFFIGRQVVIEKSSLLQTPEYLTNRVKVDYLPYGYTGRVKVGDVIIFNNQSNPKNSLYHIESPHYRLLPHDYVRVYADLVIAIESE